MRASQRGLQLGLLLVPPSGFGTGLFLERFDLGLDLCSPLFVLPTRGVQGVLRPVDGLLPPLALLLLGGLLLRVFTLTAFLLLLESK